MDHVDVVMVAEHAQVLHIVIRPPAVAPAHHVVTVGGRLGTATTVRLPAWQSLDIELAAPSSSDKALVALRSVDSIIGRLPLPLRR